MIIDSFPFFNELDILEIRLKELWDVVDFFVIIEASKTQSLQDKPFYFEENKERFMPYISKIAHMKVSDFPPNSHLWEMENYQRNQIWHAVKRLPDLATTDILMISDCDEIPKKEAVSIGIQRIIQGKEQRLVFEHLNMAFALNLNYDAEPTMLGTLMIPIEQLREVSPQELREYRKYFTKIGNKHGAAGWHFSYIGGKEQVYKKFFSCIEPFDKTRIPSFEEFSDEYDRKIKDGGSFLFSDKKDDSKTLTKIDLAKLPECIRGGQYDRLLV